MSRDSVPELWRALPVVWKLVVPAAALLGAALAFMRGEITSAVVAHDGASIEPVQGLPPHPKYAEAISELRVQLHQCTSRVSALEQVVKADVQWRVRVAAADAERDPRRRMESAGQAEDTYEDLVRFWPCPDNPRSCTDPESAARSALKSPRPPR